QLAARCARLTMAARAVSVAQRPINSASFPARGVRSCTRRGRCGGAGLSAFWGVDVPGARERHVRAAAPDGAPVGAMRLMDADSETRPADARPAAPAEMADQWPAAVSADTTPGTCPASRRQHVARAR